MSKKSPLELAQEEVAPLIEAAERRRRFLEAGADPARIQLALPGTRGSTAYRRRELALRAREAAAATHECSLLMECADALEASANDAIELWELDSMRADQHELRSLFFRKKYDETPARVLNRMGVVLGCLRAPSAKLSRDMREVAQTYDAISRGDGPAAVIIELDLTGRLERESPGRINLEIAGDPDSGTKPMLETSIDSFSIERLEAPWGARWIVRGCPLQPDHALDAIFTVYGFASREAAVEALRDERSVIRHVARLLSKPGLLSDPATRAYVKSLPELPGLGRLEYRSRNL